MIGTTLNQRFSLDKELGRGGMGAVYRATDLILGRPVAIKVLREATGDAVGARIRLEAQILARLVHEHIVRIYDFGESEGLYYFVMEEVDGASFGRRSKGLGLPGRLRVLAQVAEALDYAHRQGVIHRDVKPANVLMTLADSARLSDFGLSVLMDGTQESGVIKGTPHYMSPEQAKGRRLDHRTDLYSLGVMAYEGATGSPPFSGPTAAVLAGHASGTPEPPRSRNPALSPALESLILALLAKSPHDRPPSGAAVSSALRELLATDPTLRDAPEDGSSTSTVAWTPATATAGRVGPTSATLVVPAAVPAVAEPADPTVRRLLEEVTAEPIALSADERYYAGHYLAFLLGGSRRRGLLGRRPLDPINADRARVLLAMAWLMTRGATDEAVATAAGLLDGRVDVRPALGPVVVAKYLLGRDSPAKRKVFREIRRRLAEASAHAQGHLIDDRGVLNPGLLPQVAADLRKIAPGRAEVDDQLVERWNRVAEVWRDRPDFRRAVLRSATAGADRDPASAGLWPEVVYPLIERARWQRGLRSGAEVAWERVLAAVGLPPAGERLERAIKVAIPSRVVERLDDSADAFVDEPDLLDAFADEPPADDPEARLTLGAGAAASLNELTAPAARPRGPVRLADPDPVRVTLGELRDLYREGVEALRSASAGGGHRAVPIGPYRLAVVPSVRGRSAGQVAVQGMRNKQVEMLVPSLKGGGGGSRPILAAWAYADGSLAIAYVDFRNTHRYITWHAPTAHQDNYDDPAALNHALFTLGLEAPAAPALALSKRFRPVADG